MNTKSILSTLTVIILSSSISAFALAKEGGHRGKKIMKHLDTDGDGQISLAEFEPPRRSPFGRADSNDDGIVTLDEIEDRMESRHQERELAEAERIAKRQARLAEHFSTMDTDGDGGLSQDEIKQGMFSRMDVNEDGYITADEMKRPKGMDRRMGRGMGHGRGHE
ncbi:MAG: Ca2+-binding EF-hand superfamily protein [Candidatus Azotimanducaceae bacterium]|jgi:Ca2+-binding EF-hand superfamily protein